jgi:hypothetical protein
MTVSRTPRRWPAAARRRPIDAEIGAALKPISGDVHARQSSRTPTAAPTGSDALAGSRQMRAVIKRGQASGAFNPDLPVSWMLTVVLDIVHAASREVSAGRMREDAAERALIASVTGALSAPAGGQTAAPAKEPR